MNSRCTEIDTRQTRSVDLTVVCGTQKPDHKGRNPLGELVGN